ncbi:MAG: hypothetical protein CMC35_09645 [Flavobacteriaceae bacterium]|nr:hypothetical protein [Flavobacteriaceae bacterium]
MGYMVLNLFGKNIVSISGNYDNNANVRLLEQQLWTDFNRFPKATANTKLEELTFKSSIDSVVYKIETPFLFREKDTLFSDVRAIEFFLKGNDVESGIIDAVKLSFGEERDSMFVFLSKRLDSQTLMAHGN